MNETKCCVYGCGKPADWNVLAELDGTGRRGWLGYCQFHFDLWDIKYSDGTIVPCHK